MYPQIKVKANLGRGDPTFYCGSVHTLTVTITNPTPWPWVYNVAWGGGAGMGLTGAFPFAAFWANISLAPGASRTLTDQITMVDAPGTYPSIVVVFEMTTDTTFPDFYFQDIILEEVALPAVEVGLTWD